MTPIGIPHPETAFMHLTFDNRFVDELPGDPELRNFCRQVRGACWSSVQPTPVGDPKLLVHSPELAARLGLSDGDCRSPQFARVFGGNALLDGMAPFATAYGGHQFGGWAGQLGDGRAISLGEAVTAKGERWELQLKGAGTTPYSRHADGRAVLRSSLREFLCSEAMHHLGVPTTRALSLVLTGDEVLRDMFYDGRAAYEPGAIVCRAAPSFIRFGHFELPRSRNELELLEQLLFFTIRRDFPHLGEPSRALIPSWLTEVGRRTIEMVVHWMRVGFMHGVMNTDNMSILGLTIDYGPYGWLESFEPDWTPNTTDAMGRRYAYGSQPNISYWNFHRLLVAVYPLIEDPECCEGLLQGYADTFRTAHDAMLAAKLGLHSLEPDDPDTLIRPLIRLLQHTETDMTIFHRRLSRVPTQADATPSALLAPLEEAYYLPDTITEDDRQATLDWLRAYTARVRQEDRPSDERQSAMDAVNPRFVLRNYLAQEAIDLAQAGDPSRIHTLMEVLREPYTEQPEHAQFAARRPEWARHKPGCSMLSCSS